MYISYRQWGLRVSNPDNATAVRGLEFKGAKIVCALSPVAATVADHGVCELVHEEAGGKLFPPSNRIYLVTQYRNNTVMFPYNFNDCSHKF